MPPRFAYWTIIAGGLPTAFRASERDEILPTFQRLREKHPDAVLKWFARGRLWDSPEQARAEQEQKQRESASGRTRRDGATRTGERRDRNWRPGGDHRDPRQKFADAKKARNAARRQQRFDRTHGSGEGARPFTKDRPAGHDDARGSRPFTKDRPAGHGDARGSRPFTKDRPAGHGDARGSRPFTKDRPGGHGDTRGSRPFTKDRPAGHGDARGSRPFSRPAFGRSRQTAPREVKPRDGGLPGTSSDQKPPASNHPKRPRPAGRPPRFRRS